MKAVIVTNSQPPTPNSKKGTNGELGVGRWEFSLIDLYDAPVLSTTRLTLARGSERQGGFILR